MTLEVATGGGALEWCALLSSATFDVVDLVAGPRSCAPPRWRTGDGSHGRQTQVRGIRALPPHHLPGGDDSGRRRRGPWRAGLLARRTGPAPDDHRPPAGHFPAVGPPHAAQARLAQRTAH